VTIFADISVIPNISENKVIDGNGIISHLKRNDDAWGAIISG
jgi:hypothetical protein